MGETDMDYLDYIKGTIEGGLGELFGQLKAHRAGRFSVKAEEELHPFLVACLYDQAEGPLLVVLPGREAEEELTFLLVELLGGENVRPLPFRELVIAGERGEDPESGGLR
jgi:hypothetical protein